MIFEQMKKKLTLLLSFCVSTAFAQDVIVKQDGSTILSKVTEIGTTEVKYKKFSNQNGPTYSILKSDIQAINYENGEKGTFDDAKPVQAATIIQTQTLSFGVNPNLAEDNLNQIITEEDEFINDKISLIASPLQ